MILYIVNPKDATRKLLEFINEFDKVAGYKINIQKPVAFLYANNELSEREIKKTIPFTTTSKKNKILRNKSNQGCKRRVLAYTSLILCIKETTDGNIPYSTENST